MTPFEAIVALYLLALIITLARIINAIEDARLGWTWRDTTTITVSHQARPAFKRGTVVTIGDLKAVVRHVDGCTLTLEAL
jgi:hypothetical protein